MAQSLEGQILSRSKGEWQSKMIHRLPFDSSKPIGLFCTVWSCLTSLPSSLSSQPLSDPVVVDAIGNLYNKTALLEALLQKPRPLSIAHLRGLKDVFSVKLHALDHDGCYKCPVLDVAANGKSRFVVVRGCGCVLSERAMSNVQDANCVVCGHELQKPKITDAECKSPMIDHKPYLPIGATDEEKAELHRSLLTAQSTSKRTAKDSCSASASLNESAVKRQKMDPEQSSTVSVPANNLVDKFKSNPALRGLISTSSR